MVEYGQAPKFGWSRSVVELDVEDFSVSLDFWQNVLGFGIAYQRPAQNFAYLERPDGAQVMLCLRADSWNGDELERPFGRGVLMQFVIEGLDKIVNAVAESGCRVHRGPGEVWRRLGDVEGGRREIIVKDPDGYLVMMAEEIGQRSPTGD